MTRPLATGSNASQIEFWNGVAGDLWAGDAFATCQDRAQGPFGEAAMDALGLQPGQHVLDVGCGCGSTTFELSRRVGPSGHVLGVDISTPQLERAQRYAEALGNAVVAFRNQDVATLQFDAESFDRTFSRFGVMFFAQPVGAFANIRSGMTRGGRLAFSCWPSVEHNPWSAHTIAVATRYLPKPPGAEDLGGLSFRDPARVKRMLSEAGFARIEITLVERAMTFEPDIAGTVAQLMQYGAMAPAIAQASEDIRASIKADLGEAIRDYQTPGGVMIDGAAWIVTAQCSA